MHTPILNPPPHPRQKCLNLLPRPPQHPRIKRHTQVLQPPIDILQRPHANLLQLLVFRPRILRPHVIGFMDVFETGGVDHFAELVHHHEGAPGLDGGFGNEGDPFFEVAVGEGTVVTAEGGELLDFKIAAWFEVSVGV